MRELDLDDAQKNEGAGELSLSDILATLRRRAALIGVIVGAATLIATIVAYSLTPLYEASATVLIDPRKKTIVKDADVVSELPADTPTVESEAEIIQSKTVLARVIDTLKLREDPEFGGPAEPGRLARLFGRRTSSQSAPSSELPNYGSTALTGEPGKDIVVTYILQNLKVQRRRNTYLIEVIFTSRDAVKAARIVNTIVDVYLKQQVEAKANATGTASDWLEQKLTTLRQRVVQSEEAVARYKAENKLIDTENGQRLADREITRLMEQTLLARSQVAEARAKLDQVAKLKTQGARGSVADVLESPTVRLLKDQLVKITRREAELHTRYGPKHPEMQKIKAELADMEGRISTEIDQILANYKSAHEVAIVREKEVSNALEKLKSSQSVANEANVRLRDLERESAATRSLYEVFLARFKQTAEQQSMQLTDARLVEPATIPLYATYPKRVKIIPIGAVGGLVLALGIVLALEMTSRGLARLEDIENTTGLPHIASLPALNEGNDGDEVTPASANRIVLNQPNSAFCEAIRSLRHAVDAHWRAGRGRVVMMASALPAEGKSAISSNLALYYALTGQRTLLIDADMRRASLTRTVLQGGRQLGLLECLAQGAPVESGILRDGQTGLCFLPASGGVRGGKPVPELLEGRTFVDAIERLRKQFDVIVIDCPPLLPVIDARIIADHVDQIIFIAEWRKTEREQAKRALRLLDANIAKCIGLAVNRVERSEFGPAYSYDPTRTGRMQKLAATGRHRVRPAGLRQANLGQAA
jgi:exopolysaccharide transport family protein